VPGCGRPISAKALCQTHYRQQRVGQTNQPIRPYRKRRDGTRKLQGLSISSDCADAIEARAARAGVAPAAVIADVLEDWARHQRGKVMRRVAPRRRTPSLA